MIISHPTERTSLRHRLPDSTLSSLVYSLSKVICTIRLALGRHRPSQHKSYICVWISTLKNSVKHQGYCFVPILIPNRQDPYATNQSRAFGIDRAVATRMSDQGQETIKIVWKSKEEVTSFIHTLIIRGYE